MFEAQPDHSAELTTSTTSTTSTAGSVQLQQRDDVVMAIPDMYDDETAGRLEAFISATSPPAVHAAPQFPWDEQGAYAANGERYYLQPRHVPQLREQLEAGGCYVEHNVVDDWPQLRRTLSDPDMPTMLPYEAEMVDAIRDNPWGQIHLPAGQVPQAIALLATLFPTESVLVVTKNQVEANHYAKLLRQQTQRNVINGWEKGLTSQPHVRIFPYTARPSGWHWFNVVVFADVESAYSNTGMEIASAMPQSVIYGLVPSDAHLDSEDQLRLQLCCGPVIYQHDDRPITGTNVTVALVKAKRRRVTKLPRGMLQRKKQLILHNHLRNQQIAKLARAFNQGDSAQLLRSGIRVDEIKDVLKELGSQPRVAIVVEVPRHARELKRLLPGWKVRTGARLADPDLPMWPLDEEKVIVTSTRAAANGLAADVIIRADGAESSWCDHLALGLYGGNGEQLLVVDLQDNFDPLLRRFAAQRKLDYSERGWRMVQMKAGTKKSELALAYPGLA